MTAELTGHRLDPGSELSFILAGNATFTLKSLKTGAHFTYKVIQDFDERWNGKDLIPKDSWWVKLLTSDDNSNDSSYTYLGMISVNAVGRHRFHRTKATKAGDDAPSMKALKWVIDRLENGVGINGVEIWHAGRCGRCGRLLTVPLSVERGYGPECYQGV
jgi:hypothetical protein